MLQKVTDIKQIYVYSTTKLASETIVKNLTHIIYIFLDCRRVLEEWLKWHSLTQIQTSIY